jgi:dipeptidyl aminopeptidase/acylaminoacyl peptidase
MAFYYLLPTHDVELAAVVLFWIGLALMFSLPAYIAVRLTYLFVYLCYKYLWVVERIFQEKPLFVIPRGQPLSEAEEVRFPTTDGLTLHGCYIHAKGRRRGVILFGLEFGSTCWSCLPYVEHLVEAGFDVFAFEPRNQGESDSLPDYEPLQWVTDYEIQDARSALGYLKSRPDADPRGVGLFGISKGAGAALHAAVTDPYLRCFVTDGVFATYTTLVPYMRHWFRIYHNDYNAQGLIPSWYYGRIGLMALKRVERRRKCQFPHLDQVIGKLAGRPLLMIHGEADTYIKTNMARALFDRADEPKEFWLVEGAKHNQALHTAEAEYRERVLRFFERHLADGPAGPFPAREEVRQSEECKPAVYSERV